MDTRQIQGRVERRTRSALRACALPLAAWMAVLAGHARACPIPVYQYALENWKADPYRLTVYHEGELDSEHRAALDRIRRAAGGEAGAVANVAVETRLIEPGQERPAGVGDLPAAVLRYPEVHRMDRPVWTGRLDEAAAVAMMGSPVRGRLAELLLRRTSAVWLLVESGNRRADREAERTLREALERAVRTLVVPSSAEWGGETVTIDDNVSFEVLRVARNDPGEQFLLAMLINSEPDLDHADFRVQPMVFPVYGRGLILYALVGRGINAWTVTEAAEFLAGPCSCQIKAANPGTDLLLQADWEGRVVRLAPASAPPAGTGGFLRGLRDAEAPSGEDAP